jgi:hypothetical protein
MWRGQVFGEVRGDDAHPVAAGDEHVTVYYLLECPDRDRPVEIASHILDSHVTAVEVRQVHNSTGLD